MYSFSSAILNSESNTRDTTKILKRLFLDFDSIAIERALKKPAIGAFILSFRVTFRLSIQSKALYAALNRPVKPPNLAESLKSCDENLIQVRSESFELTAPLEVWTALWLAVVFSSSLLHQSLARRSSELFECNFQNIRLCACTLVTSSAKPDGCCGADF